jgi:hypothetical protein
LFCYCELLLVDSAWIAVQHHQQHPAVRAPHQHESYGLEFLQYLYVVITDHLVAPKLLNFHVILSLPNSMNRVTSDSINEYSGQFGSLSNVGSVTLPEQKRLQDTPDTSIGPMLAQHISGITGARDVVECNETGSNGFTDPVKRKGSVSFV